MPTSNPITHVSDTARWVAIYRAMESERPDALFKDPFARRLAGPRGEEIVRAMPRGRAMAWPMIVRTAVMDELIVRAVERDGVHTVVNLAAGLDTRPYRLPIPGALRWIEADFPDLLAYKEQQLAGEKPRCQLERVAIDLTDGEKRRAFFEDAVSGGGGGTLVVAEGLLVYLDPKEVGTLADDLHAAGFGWWLIDLGSPGLLKMLSRSWGKKLEEGNAPFRFAPAEGTEFFRPHGWAEAEYRSMWTESLRLKRTMPLAWLWNIVGKLSSQKKRKEYSRFSGIVLLQRT
ncbi:MAG TPA: class I SAM-dependent methyltransferase [Gemmatimonadales bacterium]|jgi:methyltransferase (TIGR00027 family)|nr:class I SAM-dependent methyltransferase [Gemmatimonadales bacterium]